MSKRLRIDSEPAWVLHHRPFRDSSRILDLLTREHGRVSIVARGSRSAKSRLRGVLRPFLPLRVSYVIRSELGTLTGAEMNGPPLSLLGDALLSGYYINELLLKLTHRHDPQPAVFDLYTEVVTHLAGTHSVAATLRQFEWRLLGLLGYGIDLMHEGASGVKVLDNASYEYWPEQGLVAVDDRGRRGVYTGAELQAIANQAFDDPQTLRQAGNLLRDAIAYHLGGKELKSKKVLMELRRTAAN